MGVEPFLITSTLNAVLGQRLVRRLCPTCRIATAPDSGLLSALDLPGDADGFYTAPGCPSCGGSGFRGRVAVTELLIMSDALVPLILNRSEARAIHAAACADGMISLAADGIAKARAGLTTLGELVRVTSSA
jgi:general secretion pathway protein E